jgi:hypothetical protein
MQEQNSKKNLKITTKKTPLKHKNNNKASQKLKNNNKTSQKLKNNKTSQKH